MKRIDWQIQSGPCVMCGATDYPLSYGGSAVCPACDCGHPNAQMVALRNEALTRRVRELEAALAAVGDVEGGG